MAGYVYRGDEPLKPKTAARPRRLGPFEKSKCGTNAGYHQHYRHKQEACHGCNEAHKAYDAEYRARKRAK